MNNTSTSINWKEVYKERTRRAAAIAEAGNLQYALQTNSIDQFCDITVNEILVLGLLNQGVSCFFGIFGHGATDLGEVLRVYEEYGLLKVYSVHHETEASHCASLLRWKYNIRSAVFTSIGPGALHAAAGSLVALSNGLGIYYLFGDETTHNEGPNMQQIPKREQNGYLDLCKALGNTYSIIEPHSVYTALKWGWASISNPSKEQPFYMLLPMNTQSSLVYNSNLKEIPVLKYSPPLNTIDSSYYEESVRVIRSSSRIVIKIGGGTRNVPRGLIEKLIALTGGVLVYSPNVPGIVPFSHSENMGVGGAKGSISGNYAMEHADLLIMIGARGVCQWDSSGTAWKQVKSIININSNHEDLYQYNNSLPLLGRAELVVEELIKHLSQYEDISPNSEKIAKERNQWIKMCRKKKREWLAYKAKRFSYPVLYDRAFNRELITQPAALNTAITFADSIDALKIFDAGDVQANGFQLVEDEKPGKTITDTGSSYMGFATSSILAVAAASLYYKTHDSDNESIYNEYPITFTGDGSFLMNPQILTDAAQYHLKGMIIIFDNRRMAAISGLQQAQYGNDFATHDNVVVDYKQLAESFKGVKGYFGGYTLESLKKSLKEAAKFEGLSVVHVPVYYGNNELGSLGVFGSWNVGNWCERVQKEKHQIGL